MRRFMALLSAVLISLSLPCSIIAENANGVEEEAVVEFDDETMQQRTPAEPDQEERMLDDFSFDSAKAVINGRGWEGISCKAADRKFWLPAGVERMELSEEGVAQGYLAFFVSQDFVLSVAYMDYGSIDLEEYLQIVEQNQFGNPRIEDVNGVKTVIYDEPQGDGSVCRVAASLEPDGRFLEFVFRTRNELLDLAVDVAIASIRTAENRSA